MFNELDLIKNKQLDLIKEDVENHLKYSRKIKRMMMTGISKGPKKLTQEFDVKEVVRKI